MDIIAFLPNPETDLAMGTGDPFWTPFITFLGIFIMLIIFGYIRTKHNKKSLSKNDKD